MVNGNRILGYEWCFLAFQPSHSISDYLKPSYQYQNLTE